MGEQREEVRTIARLIYLPGPGQDDETEQEIATWDGQTWARLLRDLPIEANTFALEWNDSWDNVIERLLTWCRGFHDRSGAYRRRYRAVFGQLGLLLVTLVSLRHSYQFRYVTDVPTRHEDCASICEEMLEQASVRKAIVQHYAPPAAGVPRNDPARREWNRVDTDSLRFHRSGTTSFILVGRSNTLEQGTRRWFALKCILLPYTQVDAISRATSDYLADYGTFEGSTEHLVRVWASCPRWIMMDYVKGETLAELLRREHLEQRGRRQRGRRQRGRRQRGRRWGGGDRRGGGGRGGRSRSGGLRLDLLRRLGPPLFEALAELDRHDRHHGDLSPSNIIVQRAEAASPSVVLIDLGVNHLYSRAVSGTGGPDSRYVAPETRDSGRTSERGDLYSLGLLLVAIGLEDEAGQSHTGPIPDEFYAESAVLARFLEDLTDRDPDRRLLVFRPAPGRPLFTQLAEYFEDELGALQVAHDMRADRVQNLLAPLSGSPRRAWRVLRHRRGRPLYRDRRRGMYLRWLLVWSWLTALAWYVGGLIIFVWCLRDLGLDWGNLPVSFLQDAFAAEEDSFPILDGLRDEGYPTTFAETFPARLVAISSLLLAVRHGQHVLAGITPLVATGRLVGLSLHARAADLGIRLWPLGAALCAMVPTLIYPATWPIALAVGVCFGLACNVGCLTFTRSVLGRALAAGSTTVPPVGIVGTRRMRTWTITNAFYAVTVLVIGTLLVQGYAKDEVVYAVLVCGIHLDTYLRSASGESGRSVRIALARACLAGERLQAVAARPSGPDS